MNLRVNNLHYFYCNKSDPGPHGEGRGHVVLSVPSQLFGSLSGSFSRFPGTCRWRSAFQSKLTAGVIVTVNGSICCLETVTNCLHAASALIGCHPLDPEKKISDKKKKNEPDDL